MLWLLWSRWRLLPYRVVGLARRVRKWCGWLHDPSLLRRFGRPRLATASAIAASASLYHARCSLAAAAGADAAASAIAASSSAAAAVASRRHLTLGSLAAAAVASVAIAASAAIAASRCHPTFGSITAAAIATGWTFLPVGMQSMLPTRLFELLHVVLLTHGLECVGVLPDG